MVEKETFFIKFQMNNGNSFEVIETQDASYDFHSILKMQKDKWYKIGNKIINLDNVNSVDIETKTKRDKREKQTEEEHLAAAKFMSNVNF